MIPYKYYPKVFSPSFSFSAIDNAIVWEQRDTPRSEAYYATEDIPYTYGKGAGERTYHPILKEDASFLLQDIWYDCDGAAFPDIQFSDYELLFCNRYADQHQHLGWHADDGSLIDPDKPIVVVSFGAEREIWFKEIVKDRGEPFDAGTFYGPVEKLTLQHGSVLVMPAGFQQKYLHRIPKHSKPCDARISLTFRGLKK